MTLIAHEGSNPFSFRELDAQTRSLMLQEMEGDLSLARLNDSKWFNSKGTAAYPNLLREAMLEGTERDLARALSTGNYFVERYEKRTPKGGMTTAAVPVTAPSTFAEGEFNRFYIRALCQRALDSGQIFVWVYMAKEVNNPRPESAAKIGQQVNAAQLLADLRANPGVDTALGLPPGPNSGLSVHL